MILAFLASLLLLSPPVQAGKADPLLVFAAASLTDVLGAVGAAYTDTSGNTITFSFAGSSTLARQIDHGAPADVFISASEEWMAFLEERGRLTREIPMVFASNQLVAISPFASDFTIEVLREFPVSDAFSGRLAIADPEHVPAGRYAKSALVALGWWDDLRTRLAIGHSVRGTLAYVDRGACDLGIVYGTDAEMSRKVKVVATFPDTLHPPIRYVAGVVEASGKAAAADFVAFLAEPIAQDIFRKAGFRRMPEDERSQP